MCPNPRFHTNFENLLRSSMRNCYEDLREILFWRILCAHISVHEFHDQPLLNKRHGKGSTTPEETKSQVSVYTTWQGNNDTSLKTGGYAPEWAIIFNISQYSYTGDK